MLGTCRGEGVSDDAWKSVTIKKHLGRVRRQCGCLHLHRCARPGRPRFQLHRVVRRVREERRVRDER